MQIVKSIGIHEGPGAKYSNLRQEQSVLQLSLCNTNCSTIFLSGGYMHIQYLDP